jgi:hypothetical protein
MHDTLALMYGYPFLILTYSQQSKYGRAVAIAATAVTVIAGVFGQFRGTVLMPVIYLGLTYFAARRTHSLPATVLLLPVALTFGLFIALFQFSYLFGSNLLGSNIDGLRARFEEGFVDGVGITERIDEARYVLADLQPYDLLTGKGVAGTWDSTRYIAYSYYRYGMLPGYEEEDREMAHFGPAHMILKGGLPLLLLYLFFPFLIGWKRYITSRHPFTLAASAVVVAYSLQWLVAVFPSASLSYAMVMLCAGQCINRDDSAIA